MQYWSDPDVTIIPAGETGRIISWLQKQSPDTWHQVACNWNYDHGDKVLTWILQQETCDRGTAAQIFLVEGIGHWLGDSLSDPGTFKDETHLCRIALNNWSRYRTSNFHHEYGKIPPEVLDRIKNNSALFKNTPVMDIMQYQGSGAPVSQFEAEDGKIVIAFDHWLKSRGVEITG